MRVSFVLCVDVYPAAGRACEKVQPDWQRLFENEAADWLVLAFHDLKCECWFLLSHNNKKIFFMALWPKIAASD